MRSLLITSLFVFAGFPLLSQQVAVPSYDNALAVYEDLFTGEEPLQLILSFDVNAFKNTRNQDVYHDAELTHVESEESQVTNPVQVRAGGTLRRDMCNLPPLMLHMGPATDKADSPQDMVAMKMVVPCKEKADYEPFVLREYLAYRIYHMITPLSYRVRLVRLTIIDTGKDNEVTEDWAFLQEPDELLAQRLNAMFITNHALNMYQLNPEAMNRLSMFQYMIGNTDYSVTGQHNLKILALKEYGPTGFLPVPYDFDFSGLVNADYAVPGPDLGTTSTRERYYLGPCRPDQDYEETIQELAQSHDKILEYIKGFEYLDEKEKADIIGYLDSYYKESVEPGFFDRRIAPTCRLAGTQ
jgi:hypothetical protein